MTKIFSKNLFTRVTCLFLTAFFLSSFPTGTTALALCLDNGENHIIGQNFYLTNCHSFVDAEQLLFDEHCSALVEKENKDCIDVSLTGANIVNLPSKVSLPGFAKTILFYTLQSRLKGMQQHVAGNNSSALFQYQLTLSHTNSHRTVVLLI